VDEAHLDLHLTTVDRLLFLDVRPRIEGLELGDDAIGFDVGDAKLGECITRQTDSETIRRGRQAADAERVLISPA
jgi:hypothetical protein